MSIQPLQAAIASTRAVVTQVKPEQLGDQTPCASWKVSDLINHIIGAHHFFISGLNATPPPAGETDHSAGDFVAAYDASSKACLDAFSAEGAMAKMVALPFGTMPGAAVAGLAATDTFTHGWDLAKATGQSTDLAPELAAGLLAGAKQAINPSFRGEDGKAPFTAELTAPAGASNADQLAAFLGRQV